mmetsp:Transcript_37639/g.97106  ORF Transcript_37639/g.97106 Transcript_37639/m.97106 type:complete len:781 (-) Transcript_37639:419-2761(-)
MMLRKDEKPTVFNTLVLKLSSVLFVILLPLLPKGEKIARDWPGVDKWHLVYLLFFHYACLRAVPIIVEACERYRLREMRLQGIGPKRVRSSNQRRGGSHALARYISPVMRYRFVEIFEYIAPYAFGAVFLAWLYEFLRRLVVFAFNAFFDETKVVKQPVSLEIVWYYFVMRAAFDVVSSMHATALTQIRRIHGDGKVAKLSTLDHPYVHPMEVFATGVSPPPSYPFVWLLLYYGVGADLHLWMICDVIRTVSSDAFGFHAGQKVNIGGSRRVVTVGVGMGGLVGRLNRVHAILMLALNLLEFIDVVAVGVLGKLVFVEEMSVRHILENGGSPSWLRKQGWMMIGLCMPALFLSAKLQWRRFVIYQEFMKKGSEREWRADTPEWMQHTQAFHPLFGWFLFLHHPEGPSPVFGALWRSIRQSDGSDSSEEDTSPPSPQVKGGRTRRAGSSGVKRANSRADSSEMSLVQTETFFVPKTESLLEEGRVEISRVISRLSRGGQAVVYLVEDADGRELAMKQYDQSKFNGENDERVEMEIEVLMKHQHINIVRFLDYHRDVKNGTKYLFTEYVRSGVGASGGTLKHFCERRPPPTMESILRLCYQMIKGIVFLHEQGVAHRDIKPENVLVAVSDGRPPIVKLADFGCATSSAKAATNIGTQVFQAPETLGQGYDPFKADIWSIGCTMLATLHAVDIMGEASGTYSNYHMTRMNKKSGKDNFKQMLEMSGGKYEEFTDLEKSFFEEVFEGKAEDRPTASQLHTHALFHDIRQRVESQIYSMVPPYSP